MAAGGWELTDIAYEYPDYVWAGGTGAVDPEALTGLVSFGGSLRFTSQAHMIDTTLTDARVELAGANGYLMFDVTGTTQAGETVTAEGVRFVEFSLADAQRTEAGLEIVAAPSTLTDAGAASFGTYDAGEEMDPVTAVLPLPSECGAAAAENAEEAATTSVQRTDDATAAAADAEAPVWPWIVGGIVLVLLIALLVWILVSRRRAAARAGQQS